MVLQTIKFSEFGSGGDLANDEETVGLYAADNARFNNPWTFLRPGTTADRPTPAAAMYYRLRLNTSLQQYEYYDPTLLSWVQLASSGTSFTWQEVTTTPINMMSGNGYIVNVAGLCTLNLPALSAVGDEIAVAGKSASGWQIAQAAGQSITISPVTSTVGVTGSLASVGQFDVIRLVCITANLAWTADGGGQGTFIIL